MACMSKSISHKIIDPWVNAGFTHPIGKVADVESLLLSYILSVIILVIFSNRYMIAIGDLVILFWNLYWATHHWYGTLWLVWLYSIQFFLYFICCPYMYIIYPSAPNRTARAWPYAAWNIPWELYGYHYHKIRSDEMRFFMFLKFYLNASTVNNKIILRTFFY